MKYLSILAIVLILVIGLTACSNAAPTTTTPTGMPQYRPIEVVGITGPMPPINPGGPNVIVTLKNNGGEPLVQLKAVLKLEKDYEFVFDVSAAAPLAAGQSISLQQTLLGPGSTFNSEDTYTLEISATNQSGAVFNYNVQLMIGTPPPQK